MSQDTIAQAIHALGVEPTAELVAKVKDMIDQGCSMLSHAVSQALFG